MHLRSLLFQLFNYLSIVTLDAVVGVFVLRLKLSLKLLYLSLHFFHLGAILLQFVVSVIVCSGREGI